MCQCNNQTEPTLSADDQLNRNLAFGIASRAHELMLGGNLELGAKLLPAAHALMEASGGYDDGYGQCLYTADGVQAFLSGDMAGAEVAFRKALANACSFGHLDGQVPMCQSNLAQALAKQGKYDEAQPLFQQAIAALQGIKSAACQHPDLTWINDVLEDAEKEYLAMQNELNARTMEQAQPPDSSNSQ